jgi:hypothetical protein
LLVALLDNSVILGRCILIGIVRDRIGTLPNFDLLRWVMDGVLIMLSLLPLLVDNEHVVGLLDGEYLYGSSCFDMKQESNWWRG